MCNLQSLLLPRREWGFISHYLDIIMNIVLDSKGWGCAPDMGSSKSIAVARTNQHQKVDQVKLCRIPKTME